MKEQVPMSLPPVRTPVFPIPATEPGFGFELDQIKSPPPGGSGGGPVPYPYDVEFNGTPGDATIRPGSINGLLSSNFDDVFALSVATTYYLVLSCTAVDGEITAAVLSMPTSPPAGLPAQIGQPPIAFDYLLGVVIDRVWFRVIGNGSLTAFGQEQFRISKTAPAPGTLPYDIYYSWNIFV